MLIGFFDGSLWHLEARGFFITLAAQRLLLINKRSLLREITGVFKIEKNKGNENIPSRIVHRLTMDCNETEANYVNWIGLVAT